MFHTEAFRTFFPLKYLTQKRKPNQKKSDCCRKFRSLKELSTKIASPTLDSFYAKSMVIQFLLGG